MKAKEFARMLAPKCPVRIRQECEERIWHKMTADVLEKALEGDLEIKHWRSNPVGEGFFIVTENEIFNG